MLITEQKLFSYQIVINMEINFLGQFWTIKDEILVNKAELWNSGSTIDWNLSRDYSWAGNSDFENTFTLSCKSNAKGNYDYDRALQIIQDEKFLSDDDFEIRRRRRRQTPEQFLSHSSGAETKKYNYGELVKKQVK